MPALYLVSLAVGETGAGTKGDAGAEHTGSFAASATPVEAATPAEAVSLALTGSFTVTLPWSPGDTQTYTVSDGGVSQVGILLSQHLPFLLVPQGGDSYQMQAEDLARISYADWDYNDHYWELTVQGAEAVAGVMWSDDTPDGVRTAGEPGEPGRTVRLLKDGNPVGNPATTGANGAYSLAFVRNPASSYAVAFEQPAGATFAPRFVGGDPAKDSDADALGVSGPLLAGTANTQVSAGLVRAASVGDIAWVDYNADGQFDEGEPGLPGMTVRLLSGSTVVAEAVTDSAGKYQFDDVTPGEYVVEFVNPDPAMYEFTPKGQGSDPTRDSDANPATGRTDPFFVLVNNTQRPKGGVKVECKDVPNADTFDKYKAGFVRVTKPDWDKIINHVYGKTETSDGKGDVGKENDGKTGELFEGYTGSSLTANPGNPKYTSNITVSLPTTKPDLQSVGDPPRILVEAKASSKDLAEKKVWRDQANAYVAYLKQLTPKGTVLYVTTSDVKIPAVGGTATPDSLSSLADAAGVGFWQAYGEVKATCDMTNKAWVFDFRVGASEKRGTVNTVVPLGAVAGEVKIVKPM